MSRLGVQCIEAVFSLERSQDSDVDTMRSRLKSAAVMVASILSLVAYGTVCAHGDHEPEHGGTVGLGDDQIVVEFVMEKETLNLYVDDEAGEPLETEGLIGTLTLVGPHRQQEVRLVPAGPHKLAAPGVTPVTGDRLRARIQLRSGEVVQSVALFIEPTPGSPGPPSSADAVALPGSPSGTGKTH